MNILISIFKVLLICFLISVSQYSSASDYVEIARNISIHVADAGKALSQYESALKGENESSPGYSEAAGSLYYMHLLASNLLLQSSVIGAPHEMRNDRRLEYVKFVSDHLRLAISISKNTMQLLRAVEPSLPDNILLRSSFKRFIEEIEEGESYVGNFFLLHDQQKPGDVVNIEIKEQ